MSIVTLSKESFLFERCILLGRENKSLLQMKLLRKYVKLISAIARKINSKIFSSFH